MIQKLFLSFLLLVTTLPLMACDTVKEQLGVTRRTPDEFAVVKRAPLEIPPSLTNASLPPPQPGAPRPQEISPEQKARAAIGLTGTETEAQLSQSEINLLAKTGGLSADPNIRAKVNVETDEEAERTIPTVKRLLNIGSDKPAATIIDAPAELQRIQSNKKAGQPVTQGATPNKED
jgi:hypothetical protein